MKIIAFALLTFAWVFAEDPTTDAFATASRIFTGSVYNEILLNNNDNILVSPFSVESVLALAQSGAVGDTGSEIRSALHLPSSKGETEEIFKSVLPALHSTAYTLNTANKIYVDNNLYIKDTFTKLATNVYSAEIESIEFREATETTEKINRWVEEQTNNKINDFIKEDEISALTKVILVNALYFQGNWSVPFQPLDTKKASFFTTEDGDVQIDIMYRKSAMYNYAESEELDARILELPFRGEDAAMVIVLPNQKEGIAILEKNIKRALVTPHFTEEFVEVALPKFRIENTIDFTPVLRKLGIEKAFDASEADFSDMAGIAGELFFEDVKQKTFIEVNEIGVEAAAVSAIREVHSAIPPPTKNFIVDHPFFFYLRVKDVVVFEGRVLVPTYN